MAEYLPDSSNDLTDWHSRHMWNMSLWKLDQRVFITALACKWGPFTVDLLASRLDQLDRFFSWRPDPMDAFMQDWNKERGYTFPPFSIITRLLAQVRR